MSFLPTSPVKTDYYDEIPLIRLKVLKCNSLNCCMLISHEIVYFGNSTTNLLYLKSLQPIQKSRLNTFGMRETITD